MNLRISSIPMMLEYISRPETEQADPAEAEKIFSHEDYRFEIRRYGLTSTDPLISYFSKLRNIADGDIPELSKERSTALRDKHGLWLECAMNPQKYYERYEKVRHILCEESLRSLQDRLRRVFLDGTAIDNADVISTLSFGPSFGYVYENALHLDLFGIETYCTMEELPYIILHEMHHLQVQKMMGSYGSFTAQFSPAERYIFRFSGEGLAIKFCNNAEGIVSKRLDHNISANSGIPAMSVLNRHFSEHFLLFCDTLDKVKKGLVSDSEIEEQFRTYWWNPNLYPEEMENLPQTPIYSFGNELYGCIYDAFGLKVMFECFYHPIKAVEYFNRSGCGYVIPEI